MAGSHHVVIIGGGFGGLYAARRLRRANVRLTLIDRRNFHLFQPLLYQVATGGLSPANIAAPLRALLKRQKNASVVLGEAVDVDVSGRRVLLADGAAISYDTLIVATGSRHSYFGRDEWEPHAPGLKTIEDATDLRRRLLLAFEAAEREPDAARREQLLTFVVIGGGPTGVEMAGAVAELAQHTLVRDFRRIDPARARIHLVEAADRVLPPFPPALSEKAAASLARLGVTVHTGMKVTELKPCSGGQAAGEDGGDAVELTQAVLRREDGREQNIVAGSVIWAAGVQASPLGAVLARATGAPLDRAGRVTVNADLTLPGHREIFVIGDLAMFTHQTGRPLPGVAPVAMQQGRYVADVMRARLRGLASPAFRYRDKGNLATIGRAAAVADFGWIRLSGYVAWLLWLFVHLAYIIQFDNRVLVMVQWAWNYFTRNRSARLITREHREDG